MAVKHTLAAGVAALALLVTPVGLTAQWSNHGPAISTAPAISTVHAASNRPNTTKPPTNAPTFTSSGTASKTTGWQTGSGSCNDACCQQLADSYDAYMDKYYSAILNAPPGRSKELLKLQAEAQLSGGMDAGCAFSGPNLPA